MAGLHRLRFLHSAMLNGALVLSLDPRARRRTWESIPSLRIIGPSRASGNYSPILVMDVPHEEELAHDASAQTAAERLDQDPCRRRRLRGDVPPSYRRSFPALSDPASPPTSRTPAIPVSTGSLPCPGAYVRLVTSLTPCRRELRAGGATTPQFFGMVSSEDIAVTATPAVRILDPNEVGDRSSGNTDVTHINNVSKIYSTGRSDRRGTVLHG